MAKTSFSAPELPDLPLPAADTLLKWYDARGRDLPWRSHNGRAASPYHTWLSEIMLQQTTVATVIPYYMRFTARWPNVTALAAADEQDVMQEWAGLGYYSRARNLLACARQVVTNHNGIFPNTIEELKKLPGIGDYTANAIRSIAFDLPANVVDGNVERVVSRIFAFQEPLNIPQNKAYLRTLSAMLLPQERHGDYAQAMMDMGATVCTPRKPDCPICPWQKNCRASAAGLTEQIPFIQRRAKLPERYMATFFLRSQSGKIFLRQRPAQGLLGGLWECPSTAWVENAEADLSIDLPDAVSSHMFHALHKPIIHVFSHFKLTAEIYVCDTLFPDQADQGNPVDGMWFSPDQLPPLSTLSRKIIDAAQNAATRK